MHKLHHIFHPSLSSSSSDVPAHTDSDPDPDEQPLNRSRTPSSCELFSILKALAASSPDTLDDDLPSPEPEVPQSSESSNADFMGRRLAAISISDKPTAPIDGPPDSEKLAAIIDEFGDIAGLTVDASPERFLAEAKGSFFKGVMLIGNLHLTTHRLLFHAQLPPDSELAGHDAPDVLMSGPVTLHRSGLKPNRRIWMEVHPEMITTYPGADDIRRTRPIHTVLCEMVRQMDPFDPDDPTRFNISYDTPLGEQILSFSVDTEQSAMQWRRSLENALFRHARRKWRENIGSTPSWTTMRCCVPLDRIRVNGISEYHSFATLVGLDIDVDRQRAAVQEPETAKARPRSLLARITHSPPPSPISAASAQAHYIDTSLPASFGSMDPTYNVNIAILNEQAWFAERFMSAVAQASRRQYRPDVSRPRMILEIAGQDCLATDEELDTQGLHDSHQQANAPHGLTHSMRKSEKGVLAARMFGLDQEEGVYLKRCYVVQGVMPARGHIILSRSYVCFWRRATVGEDIKYRFATSDLKGAEQAPSLRHGFHGMALQIEGQHDLKFEFWSKDSRDEVMDRLRELRNQRELLPQGSTEPDEAIRVSPGTPTSPSTSTSRTLASSPTALVSAPSITAQSSQESVPSYSPASPFGADSSAPRNESILIPSRSSTFTSRTFPDEALNYLPFVANKPLQSISRLTPRHFVCLTIGSRGDVQPYIALGLRLLQDKHRVTIVTHPEFKEWIESYPGLKHRPTGGDPTALMKLSTEHKMFSPGFFKESLGSFRQWLDDLLVDSWTGCRDADVLIESPSTMAGVHIAEALKIPYFRAFTMPWTRTTAYPQAFLVPAFEMGPSFNYSTYVLYDSIIWRATSGQINRWRKRHLQLPSTDMSALSITKIPFLYNFSSAVVPKPLDWHDDIAITGYWNLENSDEDWSPPKDLEQFIAKAKSDGRPLVYIGFGSIVVPKAAAVTKSIIAGVEKASVRAIIAKGWSSRGATEEQVDFPESCYALDKVPHGWLFPQLNAAMHHGGAGTVGASLRAGIPTLVKPWFGDQFFWAIRVTKLEVGLKVASLRADDISQALIKATTDKVMIEKAARVGASIRSENGVENALQAIRFNISRANRS